MSEERVMPADLVVGDHFRLSGVADDPAEAADTSTYEVVELDRRTIKLPAMGALPEREVLTGLTVLARRDGGEPTPMGIGPWVPLIRVGSHASA